MINERKILGSISFQLLSMPCICVGDRLERYVWIKSKRMSVSFEMHLKSIVGPTSPSKDGESISTIYNTTGCLCLISMWKEKKKKRDLSFPMIDNVEQWFVHPLKKNSLFFLFPYRFTHDSSIQHFNIQHRSQRSHWIW